MAFRVNRSSPPAAPSMYKLGANKFYGIDSSTSDDNVSLSRACGVSYFRAETENGFIEPGAVNFIRTNVGEIGKRCGVKPVEINGINISKDVTFIEKGLHVGKYVILGTLSRGGYDSFSKEKYGEPELHIYEYSNETKKYTEYIIRVGNNTKAMPFWKLFHVSDNYFFAGCSHGVIVGRLNDLFNDLKLITTAGYICPIVEYTDYNNLYYIDMLIETSNEYQTVLDAGIKIPTVFIAKSAAGGGAGYEPINKLTGWVCEQYQGDGTSTEYNLSFERGSKTSDFFAQVLNENGVWQNASVTGASAKVISFDSAPKKASGEDNVRIYYRRASTPQVEELSKCTISCNYGVAGYKDRLFLSGNSDYPNYVWFSAMDDYTYFPETSYLNFGDEKTEVRMLAGQDTNLAVFTSDKCHLVSGSINSDTENGFAPDALFTVSHIFESIDPIGNTRPIVFNNEIVYLSKNGLSAVTPSNVMDERYAQIRSDRINYWLLKEDLTKAKMCVCKDFLVLLPGQTDYSHENKIYLFDGVQFSSSNSKPFSQRQYEAYVWQGFSLRADFIWSINDELHFYIDGRIHRIPFSVDGDNEDYTDKFGNPAAPDELAVTASWETPNLYGSAFYAKKAFSRFGILLRKSLNFLDNKEINTTVKVFYKKNNEPWKMLKDYSGEQSIFRYDYINYGMFSYTPTGKTYSMDEKIKVKKAQSLKLRFVNDIPGMPLYLQAFSLEYSN